MALSSPQVIEENTESDKLQKYYCNICRKKCTRADSLAQHFLGRKHRHYLQSSKPQEQNDAIRLSSFMKAHMKEEPIVGLEYIIESKKDSLYTYTCQLCGLLICYLPTIVAHLCHSKHTKCYIIKHFPHLLPQFSKSPKKDNVKSLRDSAVTILELQGHKKEIQEVLPENDGKMREASEDTPPSNLESDSKMRVAIKDPPPSNPESDGKMRVAIKDPPPSKPESDGKTRGPSKDPPPSKPRSDGKLGGASKDPPPSKPESNGKTRGASKDPPPSKPESDGKTWGASKNTQPPKSRSDGKMRKASKDPPPSKPESDGKTQGAYRDTPPSKSRSDGKMRKASKHTPPSKPKSGNLSQSKLRLLPNQESRESYRYNKMLQKYISNDPPLAKRSRRSPGGDQDVSPSTAQISHYNKSNAIRRDCTATQELEFRTNEEFLKYFANFVISNDEDVIFIRTITQNCIKALTRFQQEEIERRKTGH